MIYKKRIVYFLLLLLPLLLISGCKTKTNQGILEAFSNSLVFEEKLTEDLPLQNEYSYQGKTIKAEWTSSDELVLTNTGKYIPNENDYEISLKGTFSIDDNTITKTFDLIAYSDINKCLEKALSDMEDFETTLDIDFPTYTLYGHTKLFLDIETTNPNIITNDGKIVSFSSNEQIVPLNITIRKHSNTLSGTKNIVIKPIDSEIILNELEKLAITTPITDSVKFKETINIEVDNITKTLDVSYKSHDTTVISDDGVLIPQSTTKTVDITIKTINNITYTFTLRVMPISNHDLLEREMNKIEIPAFVTYDMNLTNTFPYGITSNWTSSNQTILTNTGKIGANVTVYTPVTLTLVLNKGGETMTKTFNTTVCEEKHFFQDRTFLETKENTEVVNSKLQLTSNALEGYYLTREIETLNFNECVGSFNALTNDGTCELQVRVKTENNTWSKFFSYGRWGLNKNNRCVDENDTYVKMVEDEILIKSGHSGVAYQLKLILRRDKLQDQSPVASLIALKLDFNDYTFPVDISNLTKLVKYDVPKLFQRAVPSIGGVICSATSTTMLLKYKGHSFPTNGNTSTPLGYEHGFVASQVIDKEHDSYGNWSYNAFTMGAYGETAYVKRFYSYQEMFYHVALIGPMAVSIKGDVKNGVYDYHTNGHLMVCTGYNIKGDINDINNIDVFINDPNVPTVSVTMKLQDFLNVYRYVSYVIE